MAEIKDWLCPTDSDPPASEYQKHINSYVPGTGEWILDTDQYRRWREADDQGALWIRGIPGSGKSVVAARFIQKFLAQEDCPVLFFFFREIIMSNRAPRSLCQDFACGLLPHSPQLQSSLKILNRRYPRVDATPFEELWRCLSSALAATSRVFCVVDALDEMEPGHEDFIRSLIDLANRHPSSIKLVLTSRQPLYLEERFRGTSGLIDLRLDRRHVDQDIERYIEHRVSTHQPPINPEEATSIKKSICERGRGLFLYARLMMDELLAHPEDIMSRLAQLPDGLGDMYTDILREHAERSDTTLSFQRLVLQWITHSARPLRLLELATAIDSLPDRGGLRPEQDAKVAVRTACGPLLELCEDGVIQIIHHSLTEFFRDPNISHVQRTEGTSGDTLVLDSTKAHAYIARTCISYLLGGDFDVKLPSGACDSIGLKEKMLQFPFLQYSAQYWPVHTAEADGELLAIIDRLLRHSPAKFDTWKVYYRTSSRGDLSASSSALHVAAFCGLRRYVEHIVSDMDVNITDERDETPLGYAAMAGHADIITLLLQHGARHDAVNKSGMAPVHHAADRNHPSAIGALLDGGADPMLPKSKEDNSYYRQKSTIGRTALFYACRYGRLEVLEELRRKVNAEHLRNGPLHWAANAGKSKILSALLQDPEVRLAINDRDADGNTPLYLAAYAREPDTVKVLLEHGADANAVSEDKRKPSTFSTRLKSEPATRGKSATPRPFYSPLHGWAHLSAVHTPEVSIHNILRVADLLVRAGADINGRNHEGRTAFFAIEHVPYREQGFGRAIVSVLLAHGADATVTDLDGNTPLHLLTFIPVDLELVRALVNAGVDINAARKTDGKTFIMEHVNLFAYMDLKPFHELNVDFDRQNADGDTAAHLATTSMSRLGVERCLDVANPDIRNRAGETVLHKLVKCGHNEPSVIQRMLVKGFSLESRDHRGHTVLLAFLADPWYKNVDDTVKVLLELGANAQATDYEGKSGKEDCTNYHAFPLLTRDT
jgi:ankyrin repeat protein